MRISIKTASGRRVGLYLPLSLVTGILPSRLVRSAVNEQGGVSQPITRQQMRALADALRSGKKTLNGLPLIDVKSHSGEKVKIVL